MIIKSSQRAASGRLAKHLTNTQENEKAFFSESRDILADDVYGALSDMDILAQQSARCEKHLYHVSMNPDEEMSAEDWQLAWSTYETEFGLEHPPLY